MNLRFVIRRPQAFDLSVRTQATVVIPAHASFSDPHYRQQRMRLLGSSGARIDEVEERVKALVKSMDIQAEVSMASCFIGTTRDGLNSMELCIA